MWQQPLQCYFENLRTLSLEFLDRVFNNCMCSFILLLDFKKIFIQIIFVIETTYTHVQQNTIYKLTLIPLHFFYLRWLFYIFYLFFLYVLHMYIINII